MNGRWLIPVVAGMVAVLPAAEYYVDFNRGSDSAAGSVNAPLRSFIAAARER